jgi:NADH:ubiquinone oxidoreductase subunit 5 (subunit L)/multisubunit Na+/H+ antiporter MnhA subunit
MVDIFSFYPTFLILHCSFIFLFKKWIGPVGTFYASLLVFGSSLLLNLNELYLILRQGHYYYVDLGRWFFCMDLIDSQLVFCVDSLALTASALVLTLTSFALYFGIEYMYREAFINRLLYLLNMFATSVVFLFFCYDYFLIMLSWECIGLFSLLLVNFYSTRIYTIKAAQKTFVFSRVSDMFMFISFLLTIVVFNSTDLSVIFLQIPFMAFHFLFIGSTAWHFLTIFSMSLVLSGGIKAAQFFSHVWLPDAMEAPTPASALIHSSTLVVAGVFLVIRFSVLFEFTLFTNYFLILLGALTLSFGAVTAVFQNDIKKLVAYSTISQIGYLVCGCGFCCYEEVLIYLIIHALNKAFLFVLVGYTVHFFSGNTDMRQMGGAYSYSLDITVLLLGACFNLAGLPYSAGFIGKELLLFQVLRDDFISLFVRGCWMVSFFFTPIYMFILVFIVSFSTKRGTLATYSSAWSPLYSKSLYLLTNSVKLLSGDPKELVRLSAYRFQHTALTSRPTVYVLVIFWCFFFFFGESLLLITLNYNTLVDLVPSGFFVFTKSHAIFMTDSSNAFLGDTIFFFILFFTTTSMTFLFNLKYTYTYNYTRSTALIDLAACLLIVCMFSPYFLIGALTLHLFRTGLASKA